MRSKSSNHKFVFFLFGVILILSLLTVSSIISNKDDTGPRAEKNYYGLAKLGLIPSSPRRLPTELDVETGVIAVDQAGNQCPLFESRNFKEGDFGGVFLGC